MRQQTPFPQAFGASSLFQEPSGLFPQASGSIPEIVVAEAELLEPLLVPDKRPVEEIRLENGILGAVAAIKDDRVLREALTGLASVWKEVDSAWEPGKRTKLMKLIQQPGRDPDEWLHWVHDIHFTIEKYQKQMVKIADQAEIAQSRINHLPDEVRAVLEPCLQPFLTIEASIYNRLLTEKFHIEKRAFLLNEEVHSASGEIHLTPQTALKRVENTNTLIQVGTWTVGALTTAACVVQFGLGAAPPLIGLAAGLAVKFAGNLIIWWQDNTFLYPYARELAADFGNVHEECGKNGQVLKELVEMAGPPKKTIQ